MTGAAAASGALVIGSRRSRLARAQARSVADRMRTAWPELRVEHRFLTTEGDRVLDRPLPELGGKGLFTAALEEALLEGEIDLAVHSLKDLPTWTPDGLAVLAVPGREEARDVLVTPTGSGLEDLPRDAVVGTSSLRRQALLARRRPDCRPRDIRGNVDTRLRKLEAGEYDALVLAAAGLARLGALDHRARLLEPPDWLPAPGQGALAVQGRAEDEATRHLVEEIHDAVTGAAVAAERAFLAALEGGCQVPIGALATVEEDQLSLRGIVLSLDGRDAEVAAGRGPAGRPEALGRALAEEMRARGAERLLGTVKDR